MVSSFRTCYHHRSSSSARASSAPLRGRRVTERSMPAGEAWFTPEILETVHDLYLPTHTESPKISDEQFDDEGEEWKAGLTTTPGQQDSSPLVAPAARGGPAESLQQKQRLVLLRRSRMAHLFTQH